MTIKIAIVGAGFYGCYLARALGQKLGHLIDIQIFERENSPMVRAATRNQSRLHLGFHYPRSPETIAQIISGYHQFKAEFHSCLTFPKQNIYAIHQNSLIDFETYLRTMKEFKLEYDFCGSEVEPYFRDISSIEGSIYVNEGVIDLRKMCAMILSDLRADWRCGEVVEEIDASSGYLISKGIKYGPYDFMINSTYVDPNLGLPENRHFDLKYEIAAMILMKAPFGQDVALTVMDGEFASLYPCGEDAATLSSVVHTPLFRSDTVAGLERALAASMRLAHQELVGEKILAHGEQLFNIARAGVELRGLWLAPKTKLREDADAKRVCVVRQHERLISVLCGKLDAVYSVKDEVFSMMGF